MAIVPCSASSCGLGMSDTRPMLRTPRASPRSSTATIPADSCPRCWREYSPSLVSATASAWPRTPKMPHMGLDHRVGSEGDVLRRGGPLHDARDRLVVGVGEGADARA